MRFFGAGGKMGFCGRQSNFFASATGGYVFISDDENGDTYAYHYFKTGGTSTFEVETTGSFDILVVGGGGGGGADGDAGGGGGGAGGMTFHSQIQLSTGTYEVLVGTGGSQIGSSGREQGKDGNPSNFFGFTADGGGGGGGGAYSTNQPGRNGGSGGGAAGNYGNTIGIGGYGITGQGNKGGSGKITTTEYGRAGGGGGGAGRTGVDGGEVLAPDSAVGGGDGLPWLDGRWYAGGGGQGYRNGTGLYGGKGGGGRGRYFQITNPPNLHRGVDWTGGGGGAAQPSNSVGNNNGGNGIVAVRYRIQNRNLPIPGDGLVCFLDAGNEESYSGSGSSWYDLSGNGYHATLVNSPGFTANDGGGIVFNGTNQYATISNPSPYVDFSEYQSIFMIIKPSSFSVRRNPIDLSISPSGYGSSGAITLETSGSLSYYAGRNTSQYMFLSSSSTLTVNQTKMICATRNQVDTRALKWYFNGSQVSTTTANRNYSRTVNSTQNFTIADGYVSPFAGTIYTIALYNKELSSTQISDMFDYFNTRYGI